MAAFGQADIESDTVCQFKSEPLQLQTFSNNAWPDITGELPASAQQILAGVCLCVTKPAYRHHTADPGLSHPLDTVEYDCY